MRNEHGYHRADMHVQEAGGGRHSFFGRSLRGCMAIPCRQYCGRTYWLSIPITCDLFFGSVSLTLHRASENRLSELSLRAMTIS